MSAHRRQQPACIIWKGQILLQSATTPEPVAVSEDLINTAGVVPVFVRADQAAVAYIVEAPDESSAYTAVRIFAPQAIFSAVMFELGRYDPEVRAGLVRAIAIERWSNRYRFCPSCAAALRWTSAFDAKICTNPQTVHRHFPRLDPAVIVLVTHGNQALLGRAPRFPAGFYSTLAGFVEAGETLEAALRREVYEEAGVVIGATRYFGSESWPFPRSLMLGFHAQAQTVAITLRDGELEDARWFDRAELRELQAGMKETRPFFDTIARRLIDRWLAGDLSWPGPR